MQFGGFGTMTTGAPPHIWYIGTCDMRMVWREKMDIIGVPEWDLFMMEMVDRSGHHREYIGPH